MPESNLLCLRYRFGEGNSPVNTAPLLNLRSVKWSIFFSPFLGLFIILCLPFDRGHEKARGVWLNQTETGDLRPMKPELFYFLLAVTSIYISQVADDVCVRNRERKKGKAYLLLYTSSVCIFKKQDPNLTAGQIDFSNKTQPIPGCWGWVMAPLWERNVPKKWGDKCAGFCTFM